MLHHNIHGISDTCNQQLHSDLVRSKHHCLVSPENHRPIIQDHLNTIKFSRNLNFGSPEPDRVRFF